MSKERKITGVIIKRIIAIVAMIAILVPILWFADRFYFGRKDQNTHRLFGFYLEDKDSLDIVFLGASEVYNDFSPALAYSSTGITSYMFAVSYNPISLYKYELKEILKSQNPKILVVSIDPICYDNKSDLNSYSAMRSLSDTMPLSTNKINLIMERGTDSFYSHLFPTAKYHGQWTKPSKIKVLFHPYLRGYNILRGDLCHTVVGMMDPEKFHRDGSWLALRQEAKEYLNEFLDICDESGIENILFVSFPHVLSDASLYRRYQRHAEVERILMDRGYEYLDLDSMSKELNLDLDYDWNSDEHLSFHGLQKFTPWLMNILIQKYNLEPTKLSEKQKSEWENSVDYEKRFYKYFNNYIEKKPPKTREESKTFWESPGIMKKLEDLG